MALHLKPTTKVCVKVQHHGVGNLMAADLKTVEFIANRMAKYHPDAPDFSDTCQRTCWGGGGRGGGGGF